MSGESWMESGECQRDLREGKLGAHMGEVFKLFKGADACFRSKVDRANHDFAERRHASKDLHGRLAVQIERNIHDGAAAFQAIRRRVGPTPGEIDANRASSPHDLVVHRSPDWSTFFGRDAVDHQIAEK